MNAPDWLNGVDVAVTVCDREGTILFLNDQAKKTFAAAGGPALLGKKLWDCHPETARRKIRAIMETGASNSYTIEKNGAKKMIHQAPWFLGGELAGLVEFSLVIPRALPHFVRG